MSVADDSRSREPAARALAEGWYPGYPAYPATEAEGAGRLWEYLWIVRKHYWTIPLMLVVCVAAALLYSYGQKPVYAAVARIRVLPRESAAAVTGIAPMPVQGTDLATQIEILKSSDLARRVIDKLKLNYDPDFLPESATRSPGPAVAAKDPGGAASQAPMPTEDLVDDFLRGLGVYRVGVSSLVDIRYAARTPQLAANIANAVATAVELMELESDNQSTQRAIDWLRDQQHQLDANMKQTEKDLQGLEAELGILVVRSDMAAKTTLDILQERAANLGAAAAEAGSERIRCTIRYNHLTALLQQSQDALLLALEAQENPAIQDLLQQRAKMQREYDDLKKVAGPKNLELVRCQERLGRADAEIGAALRKVIDTVKARADAAEDREKQFLKEMEKARAEMATVNEKKWRYNQLKRDADRNLSIYDLLLKRAKEKDLEKDLKANTIRVMSTAVPPGEASTAMRNRRITMAALLGVFLGVALAFVLDYLDRTVKGIDEVERLLGVPVLAAVNRFPGKRRQHAPPELVVANRPKSSYAEAFRTLRMRLSVGQRMNKHLLITSAGPAEGKSTVAANLAVAIAETGKRVLLIDADIRKPSIRTIFELDMAEDRPDLVSCLKREASLEEATRSIPGVRSLGVVPTSKGISAAEISEIVEPQRLGELLQAAGEKYDAVIIDSPPMGAVGEPLLMASLIKSVLLVVKAGQTAKGLVQRAVDHLGEAGVTPVGVVLNFADVDRRGYYGYYYYRGYYGRYYGGSYGAEAKEERQEAAGS